MGDQGEPSGQGTAQALGLILPLAGLAAGIVRPDTVPAFNALGQQGHYMNQQQAASAELARKDAESQRKAAADLAARTGTAGTIENLFPGTKVDSNIDPANQIALLNASDARSRFKAEEAGRQWTRDDTRQGQESWGQIGDVRRSVGSGPADALESSVRNLRPGTVRSAEHFKGLEETQKAIAEYAKRQSDADAAVRGTQGGPVLPGVPLPENVEAYRKHAMASGVDPKAAETAAMQFQVPIEKMPGGLAAQREAVKPPYAPSVQQFTDAQGRVTIAATQAAPQTGVVSTQHTQLPGTPGQPQQAPSAGMAEIATSMQAIISGQPQFAMPQHRGMTPQTATAVLTSLRAVNAAAQAQASPDLAARIVEDQYKASLTKIENLEGVALSKTAKPQDKARAQSEITQEKLKIRVYETQMADFVKSGMRNIAPKDAPPPAPTTPRPGASPTRDKLKNEGVLK